MSLEIISNNEMAEEVIQRSRYLVLHFYAYSVMRCQNMNDVLEELAKLPDFSGVRFVVLPAEEVPQISHRLNVTTMPTVVLFRDGLQFDRIEDVNPALLKNKLKVMVTNSSRITNMRLEKLINSSYVVLFMNGNAKEPRCAFSKQIVEILLKLNVEFKTFDVLDDQEMKETLNIYSNYSRYPQLYINGHLIGGVDIVKEMADNGELLSKLLQNKPLETRLKRLIIASPVMLFMKGNKENPKCDFSRQLIQMLNEENIIFSTFDILKDEQVRQGLKKFSKWPTYPQLYVKGQLIGGLDVCKEMQKSGELQQMFV